MASCCSSVYVGIPRKPFLISAKEGGSYRTDEVASESEGRQAKKSVSFFQVLLSGHKVSNTSCFKQSDPENPSQVCPTAFFSVGSRCR